MQIVVPKLLLYTLGIFLVAILGALPPIFKKWSERQLHLFIAFGAGVFLGAIFLHLLPDTLAQGTGKITSTAMLIGFLLILLVERTILGSHRIHCDDSCGHRHKIVGITALVGLSMHSLTEGFGLGVGMSEPELGFIIFVAIIAHKATAAFSLSTIFRLAEFPLRKTLGLIILFSAMTPLGALLALPFIEALREIDLAVPTGLTAGTFLYVATMDLLPEAFHGDGERASTYIWLIFGVFVMFLIKIGGA